MGLAWQDRSLPRGKVLICKSMLAWLAESAKIDTHGAYSDGRPTNRLPAGVVGARGCRSIACAGKYREHISQDERHFVGEGFRKVAGACGAQGNARAGGSGADAVAGASGDESRRTVPHGWWPAADDISRDGYARRTAAYRSSPRSFLEHACMGCTARCGGATGRKTSGFTLAVDSIRRVGLAACEGNSERDRSRGGYRCIRSG